MNEMISEFPFHRMAKLTTGFTSMAHCKHLFCRVLSEMEESEVEFTVGKDVSHPTVCMIADLETGEESWLICSAVIASVFSHYKDELTGHKFELVQCPKIEGKKYRAVDIFEIADGEE